MATHTVNIDVVDKTIPIGNNRVIPVINQPNPALGYAASANEVAQLLRLANYYVYEAGTDTIINPYNYYDYFPEAGGGGGGGGGGVTPQTVQSMIDASIDSTVSDTSTKAVQNAAITNFVNSSIESSTAEFKGTYDSKVEMDAVTADQNDYAFLCVLNNDGSVNHYERYKWSDTEVSGSHWLFEYNVNNSSFTAEQWAAINSGVKDTDVSALGGHVNNTNNPHGVTKSQVGLSDVDNTSDADKPISTATQNALNTKFDTAGTGLDKNGTTVSHATPEGAATHAKAFYKFSTDALGHVNGVTEATEAEVNAIDSGITAAKVGQIETNKNNILYNTNNGVKNIWNVTIPSYLPSGFTITRDSDGAFIFNGNTGNSAVFCTTQVWFGTETYVLSGCPSGGSDDSYRLDILRGENSVICYGDPVEASDFVQTTSYACRIRIAANYTCNNLKFYPMICLKSLYDADSTYQPPAFSNAELTAKEQVNENNILYNANNGVKNTFDFANAPQEANVYTTVVKTSTSLKVTANNPGAGSSSVVYSGKNYPAGDYIFSCNITDYSCTSETAKIYISTSTAASTGVANKAITGNGTIQIPFHWNGGKVYVKYFPNESNTVNQSNTFTASENMIMLASISDTTYQPYAKSNVKLTEELNPTAYSTPTIMSDATDKLQIIDGGYFRLGNMAIVNMRIEVTTNITTNRWLFKDLPNPVTTLTTGSTCGAITALASSEGVSDTMLSLMAYNTTTPSGGVPNQAAIYVPGNHSGGLPAGVYILSGTYLCK